MRSLSAVQITSMDLFLAEFISSMFNVYVTLLYVQPMHFVTWKKENIYKFCLLFFHSLWNLVLCIANELRDLKYKKKAFYIFLCVRVLCFAREFLDLNILSHNLQSKDIPSMCVSAWSPIEALVLAVFPHCLHTQSSPSFMMNSSNTSFDCE